MDILSLFKQKKKEYKERSKQKKLVRTIERSNELFQICEYMGELWFTYENTLICPMDNFKESTITALENIRTSYVERNTNEK